MPSKKNRPIEESRLKTGQLYPENYRPIFDLDVDFPSHISDQLVTNMQAPPFSLSLFLPSQMSLYFFF